MISWDDFVSLVLAAPLAAVFPEVRGIGVDPSDDFDKLLAGEIRLARVMADLIDQFADV